MIAIAFQFDANRYHATQWGKHVNEGVPEWPPSPWRILRALVAVWRRAQPDLPAADVVPILQQLAAPPSFYLPPAVPAHTRHYMPVSEGRSERKTLALDSFVAVAPGERLYAVWPQAELAAAQRESLAALLTNLAYLGRAEAWCSAGLVEAPPPANCKPLDSPILESGDLDIVRVLAPRLPLKLADLCAETGDLRKGGRIDPPGAEWRLYARSADSLAPSYAAPARQVDGATPMADTVRFALAARPLPLLTDVMRVADLMRQAAMSRFGRRNGGAASPTLSGKAPDGEYLKQGNQHAFYLPTDENAAGRLEHITVWAPAGLTMQEVEALASVDALKAGDEKAIELAFLGYGWREDFRRAEGVTRRHPLFGEARVWESATPFALTRHPKLRKNADLAQGPYRVTDGPADQVKRDYLLRRGGAGQPSPLYGTAQLQEALALDNITVANRRVYPLEFYRWRKGGPNAPGAYFFRLVFDQPVSGPLALGYGCHFGLGLFKPIQEDSSLPNLPPAEAGATPQEAAP